MKKQFKFIAFAIATIAIVGCSKSDDNGSSNNNGGGDSTSVVVPNDITKDYTLEAGKTYTLDGTVAVKNGATLIIKEGVTLIAKDDDKVDYIIVEQGGKIDAQGLADKPIVMTSENKTPGAWGGLHICGKATVNSGSDNKSEVGGLPYGGSNDADNSGIIKYVRLEYTGYSYSEEQECNGISFYGVGNGTQVSYVQAYRGTDDGFEFFGGTVNISHAVATSCSDDSFDWTDGWRGRGQFLVVNQESQEECGQKTDCFLECDNGKTADLKPMSHPVLSNVTMISANGDDKKDGVMLKAHTQISLYNSVATGKNSDVIFKKGDSSIKFYQDGESVIAGLSIASEGVKTKEDVKVDGKEVTNRDVNAELTAKFEELNKCGVEMTVSGNIVSGQFAQVATLPADANNFKFERVDYVGAIKDAASDWTKGWTIAAK